MALEKEMRKYSFLIPFSSFKMMVIFASILKRKN